MSLAYYWVVGNFDTCKEIRRKFWKGNGRKFATGNKQLKNF